MSVYCLKGVGNCNVVKYGWSNIEIRISKRLFFFWGASTTSETTINKKAKAAKISKQNHLINMYYVIPLTYIY